MSVNKRKKVEYKNAFDTHTTLGYTKFSDFDVSDLSYRDAAETFWYVHNYYRLSDCINLHTSYKNLCKTFGLPIRVNGLESYDSGTHKPFDCLANIDGVEYSNVYWIIFLKDRYIKNKLISDMLIIRNHGDNLHCQKMLEKYSSNSDYDHRRAMEQIGLSAQEIADRSRQFEASQRLLEAYKKDLPEPFVVKKISETTDWKVNYFKHWNKDSHHYRSEESYANTIQYYLGENK